MTDEKPDSALLHAAERVASGEAVRWDELDDDPATARLMANLRGLEDIANLFESKRRVEPVGEILFEWGHLRVLEPLGQGSYGEVFKAFDTVLERNVALKLRHPEAAQQAQAYLQEARRLARVRHPNVLAVHGADIHDRRAGIWTDLIKGQTVESVLDRDAQLHPDQVLDAALAIARALEAVHAKNLVHGDVKAANVMVEHSGNVILMDFGAGSESGRAGKHTVGSPLVMAPERLQGDLPHPKNDIYSLGVMLYRMFAAGAYPVNAQSLQELIDHHAAGKRRTPLRSLNAKVPRHWLRLIDAMLSADPERRPTAAQCISQLQSIENLPRRRRGILAASVIAGSLALGAIVAGMGYLAARQAETEALVARDRAEAITGFLQDTLAAPMQDTGGFEVTVAAVMEDAAARLQAGEFEGDPVRQATIMETMARTYNVLANHLAAESLGRRAVALFSTHRGAQSQEAMRARLTLGETLHHLGRFDEAQSLHAQTLSDARALLGASHSYTLLSAARLAATLDLLGETEQARSMLHGVLDAIKGATLDDDAAVARGLAQQQLAHYLTRSGEFSEALPLLTGAFETMAARYGKDNHRVLPLRHSRSNVYIELGQLDLAETELRESLQIVESRGATHTPNGVSILSSLSLSLYNQGKFEEALPISERAFSTAQSVYPAGHLSVLKLQGNLANLYKELGRVAQAEAAYRDVLASASSQTSDSHHMVLLFQTNLLELLVENYRFEQALPMAIQTIELQTEALGANHLYTLYAGDLLGRAQAGMGLQDEAESTLRDVMARKREHLGADSPYLVDSQINLAELLLTRGEYQEARMLLREARRSAAVVLGEDHPKTRRAEQMLTTVQSGS